MKKKAPQLEIQRIEQNGNEQTSTRTPPQPTHSPKKCEDCHKILHFIIKAVTGNEWIFHVIGNPADCGIYGKTFNLTAN